MFDLLDFEEELRMLKARKVVGTALLGVMRREANTGTLRTLKLAIVKVRYVSRVVIN